MNNVKVELLKTMGVEIGEQFDLYHKKGGIKVSGSPFRFTDEMLLVDRRCRYDQQDCLSHLISGSLYWLPYEEPKEETK